MKWSGVFLGLLVLVDPSGLFDDIPADPACPNVPMAVSEGGSRNISILVPTSASATSFFVQKYNTTTSSWQDVILSSDEGSEKLLSSFKETLSFSGGYFKVENVSKGAEGLYRILDDMYKNCLAVVNLTVPVLAASWPSNSEQEHRNETKGEELGSWILLMVLLLSGRVVLMLMLFLLYKCGCMKSTGKVCIYLRQLLSKMTHLSLTADPSQRTGSSQDSQESEELTELVCDKDRDQAQGTRERNRDPAPENGGDLLTGDRDLTQEPREMDPLAEDKGPAQSIGGGSPTLQDCPGVSRN